MTKMASNSDFVQYIADQCSGAGEIIAKKTLDDIHHLYEESHRSD